MRHAAHPELWVEKVGAVFPELRPDAHEVVKFKGMAEGLAALREQRMTFDAFVQLTALDWTRLARMLFDRWPLPTDVAIEDVRQELLLALVERRESSDFQTIVEKWDPAKGVPLARYCVWNATVWACRWLHKRRGASRSRTYNGVAGKAPGRFYRPVSAYESEDRTLPEPVTQAGQESRLILDEAIRTVASGIRGARTRAGFDALIDAAGDTIEAGKTLHEASRAGLVRFRVRSAAEGTREVVAAVARVRRVARERHGSTA